MTKSEFEKRIGKLYYFDGRFMTISDAISKKDVIKLVDEAQKELFPLPKGTIVQNRLTGERDRIVLELKDWLPFINKLRNWFGDKK